MTLVPQWNQSKHIVFKRFNLKTKKSQFFKAYTLSSVIHFSLIFSFVNRRNALKGEENLSNAESRPVLVLDLDDTLIHSFIKEPSKTETHSKKVQVVSLVKTVSFWVAKRPGLENFLQSITKAFEVVIYTSSIREYAEAIIEEMGMKSYVSRLFHRDHCTSSADSQIRLKDLELVGSDFERMIFIDDSIIQTRLYPKNSFLIPPFRGDQKDAWLELLSPFLQKLAVYEDVRSVSGRFSTFMMEQELARYLIVKLGGRNKKASLDGSSTLTRSVVSDDTCLEEIEDGLTEAARVQIMSSNSWLVSSEMRPKAS